MLRKDFTYPSEQQSGKNWDMLYPYGFRDPMARSANTISWICSIFSDVANWVGRPKRSFLILVNVSAKNNAWWAHQINFFIFAKIHACLSISNWVTQLAQNLPVDKSSVAFQGTRRGIQKVTDLLNRPRKIYLNFEKLMLPTGGFLENLKHSITVPYHCRIFGKGAWSYSQSFECPR